MERRLREADDRVSEVEARTLQERKTLEERVRAAEARAETADAAASKVASRARYAEMRLARVREALLDDVPEDRGGKRTEGQPVMH